MYLCVRIDREMAHGGKRTTDQIPYQCKARSSIRSILNFYKPTPAHLGIKQGLLIIYSFAGELPSVITSTSASSLRWLDDSLERPFQSC